MTSTQDRIIEILNERGLPLTGKNITLINEELSKEFQDRINKSNDQILEERKKIQRLDTIIFENEFRDLELENQREVYFFLKGKINEEKYLEPRLDMLCSFSYPINLYARMLAKDIRNKLNNNKIEYFDEFKFYSHEEVLELYGVGEKYFEQISKATKELRIKFYNK